MKISILLLTTLIVLSTTVTGLQKSYTTNQEPGVIKNPERGFHTFTETQDVEYTKNQPYVGEGGTEQKSWNYTPLSVSNDYYKKSPRYATVIIRVYYLRSFKHKPLSKKQLDSIRNDLNVIRQQQVKVVLKFCYSIQIKEKDAPFSTIETHTKQLKPILHENKDVILVVQAGFIGSWGEWYYTSDDLKKVSRKKQVINLILDMVPKPIKVAVRYPHLKMLLVDSETPSTKSEALSQEKKGRLAHHNDCFLASDGDYGTYRDWPKTKIEEDKKYLEEDTKYIINGGESCRVYSPRAGCDVGAAELKRFHYTYLNFDYHPDVLNLWKKQGCYKSIQNNLGYKLMLKKVYFSKSSLDASNNNDALDFTFDIQNQGFSAPVFNRPVELVLVNGGNTGFINLSKYNSNIDLRTWLREESVIKVNGRVTISQINKELQGQGKSLSQFTGSSSSLYIRLPDSNPKLYGKHGYCIRFANAGIYDSSNGLNNLSLKLSFTSGKGTTQAPTTKAPTTKAPTTRKPTTKAPTTKAPTTKAPTTKAPTTKPSSGTGTLTGHALKAFNIVNTKRKKLKLPSYKTSRDGLKFLQDFSESQAAEKDDKWEEFESQIKNGGFGDYDYDLKTTSMSGSRYGKWVAKKKVASIKAKERGYYSVAYGKNGKLYYWISLWHSKDPSTTLSIDDEEEGDDTLVYEEEDENMLSSVFLNN